MLDFQNIEIFLYGTAAVVDTAILLVLFERRNWSRAITSLVVLVASVCLFHGAAFLHVLFQTSTGEWAAAAQWSFMVVMALGLILQPSAALHAWWHIRGHGFLRQTRRDATALLFYLPVLALPVAAQMLAVDPHASFLGLVSPLVTAYLAWLLVANGVAGMGCLHLRQRLSRESESSFLLILGVALVGLAVLEGCAILVFRHWWPEAREWIVAVATLAPIILVVALAYAILRFRLMQLVLKRSALYGAVVVALALLHTVVLADLWDSLGARFKLNFALLEGAVVIVLVLLLKPLRQRAAEALQYLMGEHLRETRARARTLALEMSSLLAEPRERVMEWFAQAVCRAMQVECAGIWLMEGDGELVARHGTAMGSLRKLDLSRGEVVELHRRLLGAEVAVCQPHDAPTQALSSALARAPASLAVAISHPQIRGLVVLGRRRRNRDFNAEQVNAVVMLVEQLGNTLHSGLLLAERTAAERRALHNEKLSTLGLVASSIAHEVKNPLSSIKTIATVLAEDAEPGSETAKDLRLITEEVDRLSRSVTEILRFARPVEAAGNRASTASAIHGTLQIMRHVAKQNGVELETDVDDDLPDVEADENVLREVVFNLLANAVRAAGVGGEVRVNNRLEDNTLIIEVHDDGPGIPRDIQERMFEPFVTAQPDGTGLGLYVVSRRLKDIGGAIHCMSRADRGTLFTVRIPAVAPSTRLGTRP